MEDANFSGLPAAFEARPVGGDSYAGVERDFSLGAF